MRYSWPWSVPGPPVQIPHGSLPTHARVLVQRHRTNQPTPPFDLFDPRRIPHGCPPHGPQPQPNGHQGHAVLSPARRGFPPGTRPRPRARLSLPPSPARSIHSAYRLAGSPACRMPSKRQLQCIASPAAGSSYSPCYFFVSGRPGPSLSPGSSARFPCSTIPSSPAACLHRLFFHFYLFPFSPSPPPTNPSPRPSPAHHRRRRPPIAAIALSFRAIHPRVRTATTLQALIPSLLRA